MLEQAPAKPMVAGPVAHVDQQRCAPTIEPSGQPAALPIEVVAAGGNEFFGPQQTTVKSGVRGQIEGDNRPGAARDRSIFVGFAAIVPAEAIEDF